MYTSQEIAEALGVSTGHISLLRRSGKLPGIAPVRLNRKAGYRYTLAALEAFAAATGDETTARQVDSLKQRKSA